MKIEVYIPDTLYHNFKREYPAADLGQVLREAMNELLSELAKQRVKNATRRR